MEDKWVTDEELLQRLKNVAKTARRNDKDFTTAILILLGQPVKMIEVEIDDLREDKAGV